MYILAVENIINSERHANKTIHAVENKILKFYN